MFQFACGQALGAKTKQKVVYYSDSRSSYATVRSLELENAFGITLPTALPEDITAMIGRWRSAPTMRRALAKQPAAFLRGRRFVVEKNFTFVTDLSTRVRDGAYVHGYWQSEEYFKAHGAAIRQVFRFRNGVGSDNNALISRISSGPSIAIHVRRGDYVSNPKALKVHGVLSPDYYLLAISRIRALEPDARVFAFSDDPEWLREVILSRIDNSECVLHNSGTQSFRDMQLMSICDHIVIANSSFSWWAAWLNNNSKKRVIAPIRWFADPKMDGNHVVPNAWERI